MWSARGAGDGREVCPGPHRSGLPAYHRRVAATPPPWFSHAVLMVEALGFLTALDTPGNDELWERCQSDGAIPAEPSEPDAVLRVLALDVARCWRVDRRQHAPAHGSELVRTWLDALANLSEGHLSVEAVEEIWVRRWLLGRPRLARIVVRANDATLSAAPALDHGVLSIRDLLAIANTALTYGAFVTLRPMAAAADDGHDLVCWVPPGGQPEFAALGIEATPPPASLDVVREGRLRQTAPSPPPPPTESLFATLERAEPPSAAVDLARLRKPAWLPRVIDGEQPDTVTKFGGVPWLAARQRMPTCPTCKGPTSLALQLRLATLPLQLGIDGTLQVFLCAGADPADCFIQQGGFVIRLETADVHPRVSDAGPRHAAKAIVGWTEIVDEPGACDWPPEHDDACEDLFDDGPAQGDKCGGYGAYPQSGEPRCVDPRCTRSTLVFQLDSSWDGILENVYFGDSGKLFIFVCKAHGAPRATGLIEYF